MNNHKHTFGQYFTTNHVYILQNMKIPTNVVNIIEPFAGNGDLLTFIHNNNNTSQYTIDCYDIEPRHTYIIQRDTLLNPPQYTNAFIITNPPYLARNKCPDKTLFDKYDVNDLYKCFIVELLTNQCIGGILIVPLNFWSSIRKADIHLRRRFLEIYDIIHINIFEEQVFEDTTTTVCAFQFAVKMSNLGKPTSDIDITMYPSNVQITTLLNEENNYMIGGYIYNLETKGQYKITRLTSKNCQPEYKTHILVKCIDDSKDSRIGLSIVDEADIYIDTTPNLTARTYMSLSICPAIDIEKQKKVAEQVNAYLEENRHKYNSLFLTNYREAKDMARKRISFELVFQMVEYILDHLVE